MREKTKKGLGLEQITTRSKGLFIVNKLNGSFDAQTDSFAMTCCHKTLIEHAVGADTLQGLVSIVSQMIDCDTTIFAYQNTVGVTKCSLRSKTTDVAAICKSFGGGGHKLASGFEKNETSCSEVVSMVIKKMKGN